VVPRTGDRESTALASILHVGFSEVFAAAGFRDVSAPGKRRVVMRVHFDA
jgi:hypothetical protein